MELDGSPVGVTVVCPGIINTPIVRPSPASVGPSITHEQLDRLAAYHRTNGALPCVVEPSWARCALGERWCLSGRTPRRFTTCGGCLAPCCGGF